jgi:hypothetical protein
MYGLREIVSAMHQVFEEFSTSCSSFATFCVLLFGWLLSLVCVLLGDSLVPLFDYSRSIFLVWTIRGFLLSHRVFFTLKFMVFFCVFYFVLLIAIYLLIFIGSYKFEKFYFRCILLCYCCCVLILRQLSYCQGEGTCRMSSHNSFWEIFSFVIIHI